MDKLADCPWSCPETKLRVAWTRITDEVQWWRVECERCHANGPQRATEEEAVRAWNIRRAPAPADALVERLVPTVIRAVMNTWTRGTIIDSAEAREAIRAVLAAIGRTGDEG